MNKTPKICSECGTSFIPGAEHIYKVRMKVKTDDGVKEKTTIQCSYTCYRKAQARNVHKKYASTRREFG